MRIAASEKVGYYPTPPQTLQLICTLLKPQTRSKSIRILDPCAGTGEALKAVADKLSADRATVQSYGIEVSDLRAAEAANLLDECLCADLFDVTTSNKAYGLLFNNPPYDDDAGNVGTRKNRLEYTFLRQTLRTLQPGGVLVYIVPRLLLTRRNVTRFLAGHFEQLQLYRLPDGEYERFNQVVLFGVRKAKSVQDEKAQEWLLTEAASANLPSLDQATVAYEVPPTIIPDERFFLRKVTLSPDEVLSAITTHGVHTTRLWTDLNRPPTDLIFRPVVPLRTGHVGSLISSGQMGVVHLGEILAKGRSVKVTDFFDADGNPVEEEDDNVAKEVERFETRVYSLGRDGSFTPIATVAQLQNFLEQYTGDIARVIEQRYTPLYKEPTAEEWRKVSRMLPNKRLPGRAESGLLPAQKHVAIAAARCCHSLGQVTVCGEMGIGKTCLSLSTISLLNAFPAIVLVPGHVVVKWQREVEQTIPGARGVIIDSLGDLTKLIHHYRPGSRVVAILSKERAKLSPGWRHATATRKVRMQVGFDAEELPITELTTVLTCPRCGVVLADKEGLPMQSLSKKRHFCTGKRRAWQGAPSGDGSEGEWIELPCNEPLYQYGGFRRWPVADYIQRKANGFFKALVADEVHVFRGKSTDQAEAYQALVNSVRYTVNLTGTLMGGRSTDLFWLRHRIDPDIRKDFAFNDEVRWAQLYGRLERTLRQEEASEDAAFSGKRRYVTRAKELPGISPAIFSRLLPSTIFVRIADLGFQLPPYKEIIVRHEMTERQKAQYDWLNETLYERLIEGFRSDNPDERQKAKALVSVWLQNTLCRPNSCFRREPVVQMVDGQKVPVLVDEPFEDELASEDHDALLDDLAAEESGEESKSGGPMILEPVVDDDELLPKEQWLQDYCRHEVENDRKVLVYLRQTGRRDIRPRLQSILVSAGLRADLLPDSVSPKKREAWIEERIDEMDILIVNPERTATGLDLIQFATAIYYEISYSLYVLSQSSRRVWRLGQQKPVKIVYAVYEDSMESAALSLMGQKMAAAALLYGDDASSAMTEESSGGGDFLSELANRVLKGEQLTSDGISGLLSQSELEGSQSVWEDFEACPELSRRDGDELEDEVDVELEQRDALVFGVQPALQLSLFDW